MSYGGAGGLHPVGGVVLLVGFASVTSGPVVLVGICPCYQRTRRSSQRCTTPAFGQGSYAVLMECLIPRPQWVGLWLDVLSHSDYRALKYSRSGGHVLYCLGCVFTRNLSHSQEKLRNHHTTDLEDDVFTVVL